jgi:ATP/maltotriose-dependent transcriptional regulator MalT
MSQTVEGKQPAAREAQSRLLLTKLHPPPQREQTVARDRLVQRLRPRPGVKLTVVAAPAGCGKTTLLGAWREAEARRRPVAWVTLDEGDNDAVVLWTHVLEALWRVCPDLAVSPFPHAVGGDRLVSVLLPRLVNQLVEQGDVALVLDDFHRLSPGVSRDSIAWLVDHAPASFQLVLGTRSEPALALALMRARGELVEVRAHELGFSRDEADALLNGRLELDLTREEIDVLVDRTEGWPAGLYLAGLSLGGVVDRGAFVDSFGGSSRTVVDFLVGEVLEAHEPEMQSLMLRSSILGRFCGSLCDAVLEQDDSERLLDALSRTNLFLIPLDDRSTWYRFHHLFAQLLQVELGHREPDLLPTLHRRAYEWHREHGSVDEAVAHGLEAGAFVETGELIAARWLDHVNVGRYEAVYGWVDRLPADLVRASAPLLHVKAWVATHTGRREEAADAMAAAEGLPDFDRGPLPDGVGSVEGSVAVLRAAFPWDDVGAGYASALRATDLEQPDSPFWPLVCYSRGWCHFFVGEFIEADPWLAAAADAGMRARHGPVACIAPGYRSLIHGELGDVAQQTFFADQAMQLMYDLGLEELCRGDVGIAFGVSLAARGELTAAAAELEYCVGNLRAFGHPIYLANALVRQIPVLRDLGDIKAAAAAIAEARATVNSCPDPGIVGERLAALERSSSTRAQKTIEALSARELSVLRALVGPLSQRDIGRELFLSHNTIRTHTRSIYRKLGASSRAEAVRLARERALI